MSKYDGMNIVRASVTTDATPPIKHKRGVWAAYFKSLMLRTLIAVLIGAALFSSKFISGGANDLTDKAKEIVAFDFIELIRGAETDEGD